MQLIYSIKFKIFLGILLTLMVLIGGMVLSIQWSFQRSFLNYVNTAEERFHHELIEELSDLYAWQRSWEPFRNNWRLWHQLKIATISAILKDEDNLPPAHMLRRQSNEPGNDTAENRIDILSNPDSERQELEKPLFKPRVALLDAQMALVVGRYQPDADIKYKPIKVDNQTVGFLAVKPIKKIMDRHDLAFSNQLNKAFYSIAGVMALLAFIISVFLTRPMIRRIQSMKEATQELTAGDYSIQLETSSRDELGLLANDFNRLARTLAKNENARQAWIADISHELRTPISILRGEIEALQDGVRQQSSETLQRLHGEVMNLERLVHDLYELSMSDIGALSYQKTHCDPVKILEQSVALYRDQFTEKNISIEFKPVSIQPIVLFADPDRLKQLFSNLLLNSLRYTDAGGQLIIKVRTDKQMFGLTFMDSAPGVESDDLPRLFDRLFRIESSRNRASGGAGLGLAICKNIVESHEATISASASPLGGVQIDILLPIQT